MDQAPESTPPLQKLMTEFLEHLEVERGRSQLTLRNYQHYLKRFVRWARALNVMTPSAITQDLIRQYRLHLNRATGASAQALKKVTQNYHLIALRTFLRYLGGRNIAALSPDKIELAKVQERELTFLESEEVGRILAAVETRTPKGKRDRAMLETLFSTGLRVSELAGLDRDSINLERGEFAVTGKGGRVRVVFLSAAARAALKTYLTVRGDSDPAVFIHYRKGGKIVISDQSSGVSDKQQLTTNNEPQITNNSRLRLTPRSIERIVGYYAKKAGITKRVTPHTWRHSFATDLLTNGADLRSVQALLGHKNVTTTQIYTHVTNPQLREVHEAFHGRRRQAEEASAVLPSAPSPPEAQKKEGDHLQPPSTSISSLSP